VKQVTLDMAGSMNLIVEECFPRAVWVIDRFRDLKKAFELSNKLRPIYSKTKEKGVAFTKLARWYNDVAETGFR